MKKAPINIVSKNINFTHALRKLHAHAILTFFNTITLGAVFTICQEKAMSEEKKKNYSFLSKPTQGSTGHSVTGQGAA